jgi:hypothetical protein
MTTPECRRGRVHEGRRWGDLHDLRYLTERQREIDPLSNAGIQIERPASRALKVQEFGVELISSRRQQRKLEITLAVRRGTAGFIRRQIRYRYGDTWQHTAAGVLDDAENCAARDLRACRRRADEQSENDRSALKES